MALILIVDDSPTEVFQMRRMLENHGFETEGAADGAEGIRKAREIRPDLILMDIVMPGVDGFREFLRGRRGALFSIVADVTGEDFHEDQIPFLRGADREAVVRRRLAQRRPDTERRADPPLRRPVQQHMGATGVLHDPARRR